MTKIVGKKFWCLNLTVVILLTFIFCGIATQSVYAAEDKDKEKEPQEQVKFWPTVTVTLLDDSGLPISGVGLSAISADFASKVRGSATTNRDGKAVFRYLKSGTYYFFGNFNAVRRHDGYAIPAMIREFKTSVTYYISESKKIDLKENGENAEIVFTVKRDAFIWFETYLQTVRSGKIVIANGKMGMEQIIPVASTDYIQIYLPMRNMYKIVTIKDNDYDSWIMEFYSHERLRIELL